jgi:phospholipid transport system substrate-binding protein
MRRRPHRHRPHRSDPGHDSDAWQNSLVEEGPRRAGEPCAARAAGTDRACGQAGRRGAWTGLDANRAAITRDPTKLRALADKYLLPHFDVDYAARLVLGKHWRTATDEQRRRFIDAFYQSLMRNYGDAVAEFTADRLKILPFKGDLATGAATVRSEVKRSNGTPVPVNYSMRATPQGWKAWDITIEGISYVKNYRTDFGAEIEQKGIDAVIQRLEAQNASGKPDAPGTAAAAGTGR